MKPLLEEVRELRKVMGDSVSCSGGVYSSKTGYLSSRFESQNFSHKLNYVLKIVLLKFIGGLGQLCGYFLCGFALDSCTYTKSRPCLQGPILTWPLLKEAL